MNIKPDPGSIEVKVSKKCGIVAIKEVTPDHLYPSAGNIVAGFAKELEQSGLFVTVFYPTRPDDKVDLTLDSKFDVTFNPNLGGNFAKSTFIGLSFFTLEPLFWYEYDYSLVGQIDIHTEKSIGKKIEAETTAEMGLKYLSLFEGETFEEQTLNSAKLSLYRQLIIKLNEYCISKQ